MPPAAPTRLDAKRRSCVQRSLREEAWQGQTVKEKGESNTTVAQRCPGEPLRVHAQVSHKTASPHFRTPPPPRRYPGGPAPHHPTPLHSGNSPSVPSNPRCSTRRMSNDQTTPSQPRPRLSRQPPCPNVAQSPLRPFHVPPSTALPLLFVPRPHLHAGRPRQQARDVSRALVPAHVVEQLQAAQRAGRSQQLRHCAAGVHRQAHVLQRQRRQGGLQQEAQGAGGPG